MTFALQNFGSDPVIKEFQIAAGDADNDDASNSLVLSAPTNSSKKWKIAPLFWSLDLADRTIGFSMQLYAGDASGTPSSMTAISARMPIAQPSSGVRSTQAPYILAPAGKYVYAVFRLDGNVPAGMVGYCGIECHAEQVD